MFLLNRALGWLGGKSARTASQETSLADGLSVSLGLDEYDDLEPDPTTEEMPADDAI